MTAAERLSDSLKDRRIDFLPKNAEKTRNVIVLDDDLASRKIFSRALEAKDCCVTEVATINELAYHIQHRFYDAVLTDYYLDNEDALAAISTVSRYSPFTKVYVMTISENIDIAVKVMEKGARTFILKSLGPRGLAEKLVKDVNCQTRPQSSSENFGIIGESKSIRHLRSQIETIKDTKAHVLVSGETGTGKELVARALHFSTARKSSRFEAINCGAIPEQLLESELFGHTRGAFTDAKTDKPGLFETCQDGTIFLDEIGEMPHSLQVKILRVLQDREIRPIGSSRSIKINARVVAATNRNLAEEVQKGNFREDLYYRLSVLNLHVPALRDRENDVELLFDYFLKIISEENNKSITHPPQEIIQKLHGWHWPGNVRELHNAVERAVILSRDSRLSCNDLFSGCFDIPKPLDKDSEANEFSIRSIPIKFGFAKRKFEEIYMDQLLTKSYGNIAAAARLAGKTRVEIYRLIDRNKINLGNYRV